MVSMMSGSIAGATRARPGCGNLELTGQEQAVAAVAATGVPTREIAQRLFLSPKTVECHLTRIYRKLGVRSKAELAHRFVIDLA